MKNQEKTSQSFAELQRGEISLDEITVQFNFRKEFNKERLEELANNIAKVGVLQPIILREENGQKILVAGERRFRAAQMAGLKTIPYRLLNLTEEEALEVTALENLHRADLNPIEEAKAFKTLLDSGNYQVEDVADRVNKSKAYVYRSIRLLELPQEAQDALIAGQITSGHARHLLRLTADECKEMLGEILEEGLSVKEVTEQMEWHFGKSLKEAVFPTSTAYADCPSCRNCLHNSSNQQDLFEEEIEKGRCTNAQCFNKKHNAFLEEQMVKAKKEAKLNGFVFQEDKYGYGSESYFNSHPVLNPDEINKLEKEISAHPAYFGIGVDKKDASIRIFAIEKESTSWLADLRGTDDEEEPAEEENGKEQFIREKTEQLVWKSLPLFKYQPTNQELEDALPFRYADDKQQEFICKLFGMKDLSLESFKKLSGEQILTILAANRNLSSWNFEENICELAGVDYQALEASCRQKAEEGWQKEEGK